MGYAYNEGLWTPQVFCGNTEVSSYLIQVGTYTVVGNRCIISGFVAINVLGSASGDVTIRGLPYDPRPVLNHRQAVAIMTDVLQNVGGESIQANINETGPYIYVYMFNTGVLQALTEIYLKVNSNFRVNCAYEI